ncbi:MAG: hypothetical protein AB2810_18670 [Candidatus Thiodiazotropha endolucinida]
MAVDTPSQGFVFWPVGTGDSTTVKINDETYLQVDIRHMEKADDDDDPAWPVVDHLIEILPQADGRPYLSTFALTHPDQDHCQGFTKLLEEVEIGELWLSPRVFQEYQDNEDLCDDAEAFQEEAMRRVHATIDAGGDPGSGDRVRIIGYDELLQDEPYIGFPEAFFSVPGHAVHTLDGQDYGDQFRAFIHAPFADDSYGDRNDCSLAFQISLSDTDGVGKALLLGDLKYPILKRIFDVSDPEDLEWNILLAPHHCSKSAMYWQDEGDDTEKLKQYILDAMAASALSPGYIISSSSPIPASNKPGDNPPHAIAKRQYLRIVPDEFMCTHETPNEENPEPIAFEVTNEGLGYLGAVAAAASLEESVNAAQGSDQPPTTAVGFGCGTK